MTTSVRDATVGDRDAFVTMWRDFVAAKPSEPGNHDLAEQNWARAIDPAHPLRCILATDDGVAQGFTLFLDFPFTFSAGNVCYLLDIYVRPAARCRGHARAMIDHLASIGRASGWYKIFWMTEPDNHRARRLYDLVAMQSKLIRYDLVLSDGNPP